MDQLKDCATFFPHKTGHDLENGQPIEYDKRKTYPAKIQKDGQINAGAHQ